MTTESTPKNITDVITAFCREIDSTTAPTYVQVSPSPGSIPNECYGNVDQRITRDGGTVVYGWTIWEIPGEFIEAEFHAVWRSPEGTLIDVTPKPDGEKSILFLPDTTRKYEQQPRDNIRKVLKDTPFTRHAMEFGQVQFEIKKRNWKDGRVDPEGANRDMQQYVHSLRAQKLATRQSVQKIGRNEPCPCGSGKKFKYCCGP